MSEGKTAWKCKDSVTFKVYFTDKTNMKAIEFVTRTKLRKSPKTQRKKNKMKMIKKKMTYIKNTAQ